MSKVNPYEYLNVPSGWTCKRLEECTQDRNISYGIVQPGQHTESGVPVIRVNNVNNGQLELKDVLKVSHEIEKKYERTRLKGGEILLTLVGSTGQSFVAPKELAGWNVPRAIAVIRVDESIGANWINICLQTEEVKHFLNVRANTTVQKTLNLKDVRDIPILIPPKDVKTSIENIALGLSQKIRLNTQTNQTLESIAQAIFKSWFVDFEPVKAKMAAKERWYAMQPTSESASPVCYADEAALPDLETYTNLAAMCAISGKSEIELAQLQQQNPDQYQQLAETAALFPSVMVDSELGEIPEGWAVIDTESISEKIGMGPFGSNIKVSTFVDAGVPIISGQHLKEALLTENDFNHITIEHAKKLKSSVVKSEDIIFTHAGNIGQVSLIPKNTTAEKYIISQRQFFLRADREKVSPYFLLYFFRSPFGQHLLLSNASQVGVPSIARPSSHLKSIELVLPALKTMERFEILIINICNRIIANRRSTETLSRLRDTLLPKLLSGEIDLTKVENEVT